LERGQEIFNNYSIFRNFLYFCKKKITFHSGICVETLVGMLADAVSFDISETYAQMSANEKLLY